MTLPENYQAVVNEARNALFENNAAEYNKKIQQLSELLDLSHGQAQMLVLGIK